jgi:hypothetical protein
MKWEQEKENFEKVLESLADSYWLEMRFVEGLLETLHETPNKSTFLRKAKRRASYSDHWIRDDLCCLVNNLPHLADYY